MGIREGRTRWQWSESGTELASRGKRGWRSYERFGLNMVLGTGCWGWGGKRWHGQKGKCYNLMAKK